MPKRALYIKKDNLVPRVHVLLDPGQLGNEIGKQNLIAGVMGGEGTGTFEGAYFEIAKYIHV